MLISKIGDFKETPEFENTSFKKNLNELSGMISEKTGEGCVVGIENNELADNGVKTVISFFKKVGIVVSLLKTPYTSFQIENASGNKLIFSTSQSDADYGICESLLEFVDELEISDDSKREFLGKVIGSYDYNSKDSYSTQFLNAVGSNEEFCKFFFDKTQNLLRGGHTHILEGSIINDSYIFDVISNHKDDLFRKDILTGVSGYATLILDHIGCQSVLSEEVDSGGFHEIQIYTHSGIKIGNFRQEHFESRYLDDSFLERLLKFISADKVLNEENGYDYYVDGIFFGENLDTGYKGIEKIYSMLLDSSSISTSFTSKIMEQEEKSSNKQE